MQHLEQALPEGLSPTQVANEDALAQAAGKVLCKQAASVSDTSAVMELPGIVVMYKPRFTDGGISQKPPPRPSPPKPPQEDLEEELASIRQDLEEGRLSKAHKAVTALYAEHPQDEIGRLKEQIEQKVRSRIEVKLLGTASGTHILDAQVALVTLSGREASLRFNVEPYENVYFYLYGMDQVGSLRVLFPVPHASGRGSNPLLAKQAYWVPSEIPEQGFPLHGEEGHIEEITMVTSRWPARELEQWGAALAGAGGEEASHHLRQALKERQEAQVGGCDIRTLQFAR